MSYGLLRALLFRIDAELAHDLTLKSLRAVDRCGALRALVHAPAASQAMPVSVMGLSFPNRLGLAAGLDKNGAYVDALAALGFGFIEVGTVTPRAQPGNPKPRVFRLPAAGAIINRMGFNNLGVDALLENLNRTRYRGVLGINIGKNFDTKIEDAAADYVHCLRAVYARASYITVNISSPNTPNLRALQQHDELAALLGAVMAERAQLARTQQRQVPIAVKIAPDLSREQLELIADTLLAHGVDGVIATNTTVARESVRQLPHGMENGGLSGEPLFARATEIVRQLAALSKGRIPIIGVGGIASGADARRKLEAGASLVQIYSGLIYRGPALVSEILAALEATATEEESHAYRRA